MIHVYFTTLELYIVSKAFFTMVLVFIKFMNFKTVINPFYCILSTTELLLTYQGVRKNVPGRLCETCCYVVDIISKRNIFSLFLLYSPILKRAFYPSLPELIAFEAFRTST